ncbi:uncharacterized protein LOC105445040 isoform X2 [Strongylocentrotus purpuratus]|uniref:Uncharacterized protein n=1 Tax=Strongylocentrotus purpuratus TaxID=7668 RepID=A0A7M7N5V8_STRPU|nr:uncharacterized protein LOC105445040 isoform X2 [Strongylocentrotus purpuratus]
MKAFYLILLVFLKSCFFFYSDGYILSPFRLVNGSSRHEGRVEFEVDDDDYEDGVLSDNGWTIDSADWVCQKLGYPNAIFAPGASRFGKGQYNVFILDNQGRGVLECEYPDSGDSDSDEYVPDCSSGNVQAAGVTCNKPGCFRIRKPERDRVTIKEMDQIESNDDCRALCRDEETLFAAQRDEMCFCFNDPSILNEENSGCDRPCAGNSRQLCGGGNDIFTVFFNVSAGFCPEISGVNLNVYGSRYGRYRFGDIVRANCSGGSRLMGDDELQCLGEPGSFKWNGTVPSCVDGTTVQPGTTNNPRTQLTGRSTAPPLTGTGVDRVTAASSTVSVDMGMEARSETKSLVVPVAVSVVGVIIVAVLAILLFMYFKRTRKTQSEMKQKPTSTESKFNNMSYSIHNIPNNEGPSYYEPNTITEGTVGTDGLIDNVLYKPADIVRRGPNEYELDQDSSQNPTQYGLIDNVLYKPAGNIRRDPNQHERDQSSTNDTPHYGLIDNVLYKPVESTENTQNFRQLPNGYDLPSNDSEYASPDEQASRGFHQDGELIDNILYKPADNQAIQTGHASRKYYEIKPELTTGDYAVADCPIPDRIVPPGAKYYDFEPQPAHSRTQTKFAGYDAVHDIDDDDSELTTDGRNGQRFVVRPDDTSSMIHEYAAVDNDRDPASNFASTNNGTTSAAVKQKPFPRYATVQKKL